MDVSYQSCLALLAVALAFVRTCEQVALLHRRLASTQDSRPSQRASILTPVASAAALAYGYAIDADPTLRLVAWLNVSTGLMACAFTRGRLLQHTPAEMVDAGEQGNV